MKRNTIKTRIFLTTTLLVLVSVTLPSRPSAAGTDPYLGEIMWVTFDYCPRGWVTADGRLLPITQNRKLFSLFGTVYGGDGRVTFALPDLRGRASISSGRGPGLTPYRIGDRGGEERVSLAEEQMPSHNHAVNAGRKAVSKNPKDRIPGKLESKGYDSEARAVVTMADSMLADTGSGESHENRPPFLTLRACVAVRGQFPFRN